MKNFSLWWNDNRALIEKLSTLWFIPKKFKVAIAVIIAVIEATLAGNPTAFNDIHINGNDTVRV